MSSNALSNPTTQCSEQFIEDPTSTEKVASTKKNKRHTSNVWNFYDKVYKDVEIDKNGEKVKVRVLYAVCKFCKVEREYFSTKGTTHLHNHTERCPRRFVVDVSQQLINATITKPDGSTVLKSFVLDDKRVRSCLQRLSLCMNILLI